MASCDVALGQNGQSMGDVKLENVTVSDAVIFPETTLADTATAHSIVDRDAKIEGIPLDGALISAHSTLTYAMVSGE